MCWDRKAHGDSHPSGAGSRHQLTVHLEFDALNLGAEGGPAHCYRVGECWLVRLNIHGCVAPADQYLGGLRSVKTDPSVAIALPVLSEVRDAST